MFSCYFLRIIRQSVQVLCPVFSRKVFFRGVEGSNKVWTSKTSLSVSRQDFVEHGGRVISAAKQLEILLVPLVAAFSFGKRWIPFREPINLPLQGATSETVTKRATSETVTSESAKWNTLKTIRCQRVVWDSFCISLKTNWTPVTQELYLDEKTMPHVCVIVSCIYGRLFLYLMNSKSDATYTRTYLLMRKQCLMFMLLLATSTTDYFCTSWTANRTPLTQGLISWWENNASCLCYC